VVLSQLAGVGGGREREAEGGEKAEIGRCGHTGAWRRIGAEVKDKGGENCMTGRAIGDPFQLHQDSW
jgi:hypothetical protein